MVWLILAQFLLLELAQTGQVVGSTADPVLGTDSHTEELAILVICCSLSSPSLEIGPWAGKGQEGMKNRGNPVQGRWVIACGLG